MTKLEKAKKRLHKMYDQYCKFEKERDEYDCGNTLFKELNPSLAGKMERQLTEMHKQLAYCKSLEA